MFYRGEKIQILGKSPTLTQIGLANGRVFFVKNEELTEYAVTTKNKSLNSLILPVELSPIFLLALLEVKDSVRIRVHYPVHAETLVQETFSKAGVILPIDIRPLASGIRGGQTIQRDWAAVVWFPELIGVPLPEGTKKEKTGGLMNSRRDVVLAILKAGFEITEYTHEKQ